MHVWTARWVKHHATGNEVPQAEYTGYAGLPIRRLAGVLAGRLEPTPDLLPGPASSGRTLSRVLIRRHAASSRWHRHSIASPNFRRNRLRFERCGVIHVLTAVITAKGACTMTTSAIANREPGQATATEKPEPPKKAKVTAPRPRVPPAKVKSVHKTTPAKKGAKAAHKATARPAARVRPVGNTD